MKAKFERVIAGEGRLFAAFEGWGARFHAPHHFHPELELTGIIGGDGRRIIGDAIEPFAAGDLVLIGANVPHQYSSAGSCLDAGSRAGSVGVQFLPEVFGTAFLESLDGAPVRCLMGRAGRGLAFTGSVVGAVAGRMRTLVRVSGPRRFVLLLEIVELLARSRSARELASHGFSPVLGGGEASRVSRACDFIQQRFELRSWSFRMDQ